MAKTNIISKIKELSEPVCQSLGLMLWDAEFKKEGSEWYLRLFIDSDTGVTLTDCENMSRAMDSILDEADLIDVSYHFEVCSPGIERTLKTNKQFKMFIGTKVNIKLFAAKNSSKQIEGVLSGCTDEGVSIICDDKEINILYSEIANAKTVEIF